MNEYEEAHLVAKMMAEHGSMFVRCLARHCMSRIVITGSVSKRLFRNFGRHI